MDSVEDVTLTDVIDQARAAGQNDIAVAIETIDGACHTGGEGLARSDLELEDLPFYEDERLLAFALGMSAGGLLEHKYSERLADVEE